MEIKIVFKFDTSNGKDPVEVAEGRISGFVESGDSLLDVAWIYTRKNDKEEWREV